MGWKDILIQVGSGPREAQRLGIAAELAERLGAQLRGAYLRGPRLVDVAAASPDLGWMLSADVQRVTLEQEAEDERAAERARAMFFALVGPHLSPAWVDQEWAADPWIAQIRCADLTIVGAAGEAGLFAPLSPDRLAAVSGRPILILPSQTERPVGRQILVAWNGEREASRALNDAIGLIEQADDVAVVTVSTADSAPVDHCELKAHLRLHGVSATMVKRSGDAASVLRREAAERGADLIVMGVYGRSRMAEWVLGGVSRSMLRDPVLPILMSH